MAFNVNFYTFAKKSNSTARPTGTGEVISCILKTDSSIRNPVIILERGLASTPTWNYAYIPEYGRYYFINNWSWTDHRLWAADMTCDILATFKPQIGDASLYILRSSAASDGNIVDDYYPTKMTCQTDVTIGTSPWIHTIGSDDIDLSAGVFVVGYVTSQQPNDSHMYGSVVYSAMRQSGLRALVDELLDDTLLSGSGFNTADATLALQKSLIDPLSYIKSCIWLPVLYESIGGTELNSLHIWDWSIPCSHKIISNDPPYIQYAVTLDLIKHPLTLTRGNYLNTAPYTRVNLDLPPFGNLELDTTLTSNATQVQSLITFDLITGQGRARVLIDGVCTDMAESQIGVPIQLSQVMKDYLGAAQSGFNAVVGTISGIVSGQYAGAISSAGNGIANAVRAMQPRGSSVGGAGSFAHLKNRARLYHQFMIPVDEDNSHCGRPLCQIRQVSTLPGYLLVKDAELDLAGFTEEAAEIRDIMEAGFFYE